MTLAALDDRDRIGPYRLVKAIGAGGSSRIDLACLDRAYGFQRHVVVKRPLEHLRDDPRAAASLHREARIGGRLRHPQLVGVLDAGSHAGYDYLVLEYVHGAALRALMADDAPGRVREVPLAVALAIASDVARGLHHAHELTDERGAPLGLVHRDVSPGNVLVALDGAVKLADFGIAKETRVTTLSGSMHGTVTYMAPEQCRGHAFDRRADVFSLGVILYELITGSRLFWADNDVASLHRVLSGSVPRPRKLKPKLAPQLEELVMTAIAHDPERRFASARAFADAIEAHAEDTGELLGARWIARWVERVLGRREVPWSAAPTLIDAVPRGDGSLVDLIAAVIADGDPRDDFGPNDPDAAEDTERRADRRHRPRRRAARRALALALAGGLAGGAAFAWLATRPRTASEDRGPDTAAADRKPDTAAADRKPDTTAADRNPDTAADDRKPDTTAADRRSDVRTPDRQIPDQRSPNRRTAAADQRTPDRRPAAADQRTPDRRPAAADQRTPDQRPAAADTAAPVGGAARPAAPPGASPARAGAGSGQPAKQRVEWDPTLLLPTDGSATPRGGSR